MAKHSLDAFEVRKRTIAARLVLKLVVAGELAVQCAVEIGGLRALESELLPKTCLIKFACFLL